MVAFWTLKPWKIALIYALVASCVTIAFSMHERTFWRPIVHEFASGEVVQHPYIHNFSTIIDFAVLNPLAIYFLLNANLGYRETFQHFGRGGDLAPFHKVGLAAVAIIVGISTMRFYFEGFVGETFYSATFAPSLNSGAVITSSV